MRITESQLRRIVKRMLSEQAMAPTVEDPATTAAEAKAVEMAKGITPKLLNSDDEFERSRADEIIEGICEMLRDLPKFRNNPRAVRSALVMQGVKNVVATAIAETFGDYHSNDPRDPTSPEEPGYFGY